jgi:type VI protein secretion system component VasK
MYGFLQIVGVLIFIYGVAESKPEFYLVGAILVFLIWGFSNKKEIEITKQRNKTILWIVIVGLIVFGVVTSNPWFWVAGIIVAWINHIKKEGEEEKQKEYKAEI